MVPHNMGLIESFIAMTGFKLSDISYKVVGDTMIVRCPGPDGGWDFYSWDGYDFDYSDAATFEQADEDQA
jgi:hypothetical protein